MTTPDSAAHPAATPQQTAGDDSRYAAKSGILQILSIIAQAMQPVYHVMIARLFGPAVYGLYGGALAIVEVLARLGVFGADKAMYRFVAGHRAKGEATAESWALGSGLRINLMAGLLVATGTLLAADTLADLFRKPEVAPFLRGLSPTILATSMVITVVAACLAGRAARAPLLVRGIVEPVALAVCALIAFAAGGGWMALAVAHSTAMVLTAVAAFLVAATAFGGRRLWGALRARKHPEFLGFARPVATLEVINTLRQQADSIVLLAFLPLEAAAFYKASDYIGRVAAQIRNAFDGVAGPLISAAIHTGDRERVRKNLQFLTRWVATLTLPLTTSLIALREPLLRMFGPEYVVAGTVVIVHVVGHTANGILGLCGNVMMMSGRARWLTFNQVLALGTNILLCNLFIPTWGLVGAVTGFAAAIAITVLGYVGQVYFLERVSPFHTALVKPFLAAGACLSVQLLVGILWSKPGIVIPVTLISGLLVYVSTWWALGPATEERQLVQSLIARALKR